MTQEGTGVKGDKQRVALTLKHIYSVNVLLKDIMGKLSDLSLHSSIVPDFIIKIFGDGTTLKIIDNIS